MIHYLADHVGFILHERAQQWEGAGAGYLSIKSFPRGAAQYALGRRRYLIHDTKYLVLNHGQPYEISIDGDGETESFCVFFAPGFAPMVRRDLATSTDQMLSDPWRSPAHAPAFVERTYEHDGVVSLLTQMRPHCATPDGAWLTEYMHLLMQQMLLGQTEVAREIAAVPATRAATRAELYRRLHDARDYADACFATPITLDDMALVAALSPNHLLRTFRQMFGLTPYQYIVAKRITYAQQLLRTTDRPVTDICFATGWSSVGSFSWWFRRRVGVSPSVFRQGAR